MITQIAATQSALTSVAKILLGGHLKTCVLERVQDGDDEVLDEMLITIQKLMRGGQTIDDAGYEVQYN